MKDISHCRGKETGEDAPWASASTRGEASSSFSRGRRSAGIPRQREGRASRGGMLTGRHKRPLVCPASAPAPALHQQHRWIERVSRMQHAWSSISQVSIILNTYIYFSCVPGEETHARTRLLEQYMDELPQLLLRASSGQQMCWPWTRRMEHAQEGGTGGEEGYVREKETRPWRRRP